MTTIAVRDGIMAADSATSAGNVRLGSTTKKIRRLSNGWLFASCGGTGDGCKLDRWIEEGMPRDSEPKVDDGVLALAITPDGRVLHFDSSMIAYEIDAPYHAIGSGWELAFGAMAHGANAAEAVEAACMHDTGSHGPVQVEAAAIVRRIHSPTRKGTVSAARVRQAVHAVLHDPARSKAAAASLSPPRP